MKQLPKNNEDFLVFENDKLELSEMYYLRGGDGGEGGDPLDPPPPPPPPVNP